MNRQYPRVEIRSYIAEAGKEYIPYGSTIVARRTKTLEVDAVIIVPQRWSLEDIQEELLDLTAEIADRMDTPLKIRPDLSTVRVHSVSGDELVLTADWEAE